MEEKRVFSLVGRVLYDTRKELGFSQDEVCYGLCSKSFFSRIEKGETEPDYLLVEALFTRMGVDAPKGLVPLTVEHFRRIKIQDELSTIVDSRSERRLELVKEYEKGSPLNKIEKQIYALNKGWYLSQFDGKKEEVIKIYEKALKLTLSDFNVESNEMPEGLLSRYEIALINNIAHAEYQIYLNDKQDIFNRESAMKRILFLEDYFKKRIKNYERQTMYSIILFNLTNWFGLEGFIEKALMYAKKGFSLERKSKYYFESHLFNIGYSYASLDVNNKSKDIIQKSFAIMKINDEFNDVRYLSECINKKFLFDFPLN